MKKVYILIPDEDIFKYILVPFEDVSRITLYAIINNDISFNFIYYEYSINA